MSQREGPASTAATHTAERSLGSSPWAVPEARERAATDTEVLPSLAPDSASISFALERGRALERSEHSASVHRLRQAVRIGILVWLSTGILDALVVHLADAGSLRYFLGLRLIGVVAGFAALWPFRGAALPSPRALSWIDLGLFTLVAVLVSLMCVSFRGIASPYAAGLIVILVARGATTLAPWRRGAWLFGAPALSFPVTMLVASVFDQRIAAQFNDSADLGSFITSLFLLATSWLLLTVGGDFAWRLRRQALEARNVGRYKLERRLGAGGMAEVWAAYDLTLKQRVALKTVAGHRPGSSAVARLEREVRALAELTHPNTVRVFDYGVTDDGLWYYAMELLHGETLRELVSREGALPVERVIAIARQVLRALGEAHQKGIIHRDIKPENVFVAELGGESDVAKLLDFGIAKATIGDDAALTHPGWVAGTPAYMPPEVILGGAADVRSDIYSFGATLYFALTAHLPFTEETHPALFLAHLESAPPSLSLASPEPVALALERIVQRCMAKDPSERYTSTQALIDELLSVARSTRAQASPIDTQTPAANGGTIMTTNHLPRIVSEAEWRTASDALLAKEKAATRERDALAAERRRLPMVLVDKEYTLQGPNGKPTLRDLFEGRSQLIIYHFMFAPGVDGWPDAGCPGCSFFIDNVGHLAHLHARDTSFALVSRAPLDKLQAYRRRMGWTLPWYSSAASDFNDDFGLTTDAGETFGLSVFLREGDRVFRSYFTAGRGVEALGSVWTFLDLTPWGRQEDWEDSPPGRPQTPPYQWWRRHDEYGK